MGRMSDPDPMARFDPDAPDADDLEERHVAFRALKRMRALLVLGPLVVGLLVAAGIGASKLWADPPERDAVSMVVTCWNGVEAPADECTEPQGGPGLQWVFPSFRLDDARCQEIKRPARDEPRPVEFTCDRTLDQRRVVLVYTARTSLDQGMAFLRRTYDASPDEQADGERLVFRSPVVDDNGNVALTAAYAEHPFTVTVRAPTEELRDTALDELVQFRPADEVVVRR